MSTRLERTDRGRRRYLLTTLQLEAMIEAGVFPDGDDLELLGGVLYRMVKKEPHNFAVAQVADALRRALPEDFHVREEKSLHLSKHSLPEPDVVVAVGRSSTYRPQPPEARDVALLVEVCHHSQKSDYQESIADMQPLECRRTGSSTSIAVEVEVFVGPVGRGPGPFHSLQEATQAAPSSGLRPDPATRKRVPRVPPAPSREKGSINLLPPGEGAAQRRMRDGCRQNETALGRGPDARYSESAWYGEDRAVPVILLSKPVGTIAVKDVLPPADLTS